MVWVMESTLNLICGINQEDENPKNQQVCLPEFTPP